MTRSEFLLALPMLCVAPHLDEQHRTLLVDVDAVLLAVTGWDIPDALKTEIASLRSRLEAALEG